jgi:hypothetical protein
MNRVLFMQLRKFKIIILGSKLTGDFTPCQKKKDRFFFKNLNRRTLAWEQRNICCRID